LVILATIYFPSSADSTFLAFSFLRLGIIWAYMSKVVWMLVCLVFLGFVGNDKSRRSSDTRFGHTRLQFFTTEQRLKRLD